MVAARQLTEVDARTYLRQPGAAETGEEAVLRWVAREYGVPFTRLDELEPDKQVLALFPRACCSGMNSCRSGGSTTRSR